MCFGLTALLAECLTGLMLMLSTSDSPFTNIQQNLKQDCQDGCMHMA